jgi:hypothetical protein
MIQMRQQPFHPDAGAADIARRLAALDRSEDRLQRRSGFAVRARVAPQPGEVRRGATVEALLLIRRIFRDKSSIAGPHEGRSQRVDFDAPIEQGC